MIKFPSSIFFYLCTLIILFALSACSSESLPNAPQGTGKAETPGGAFSGTYQALMEKLTLEQLVSRADSIVVGTVANITNYKDDDQQMTYALVTISVNDVVKGNNSSDEIVIRLVGGGGGNGLHGWLEDTPEFQLLEEVLVFVQQEDSGTFCTVGGFQGKYTVVEGNISGGNTTLPAFISQTKGIMAQD